MEEASKRVAAFIDAIYCSGKVCDAEGREHRLYANIDPEEGRFLTRLVQGDPAVCKTLEVGCAFGLASLHLCAGLYGREGVHHTIVDPYQHSGWHGVGVGHLDAVGFHDFTLLESGSEFALPRLAEGEAGSFDLVFVDGCHTFDHTLIDIFYATRLLRVGGYLVVDDCTLPPVAKAISYVKKYPAYAYCDGVKPQGCWRRLLAAAVRTFFPPVFAATLLPRYLFDCYYIRVGYPRMIALRKVAEDKRAWDWFRSF